MAEKPEDLNLPNAVIGRIIKETLPEGAIVSKEARNAISKAASIFVLYSTSWANNFALQQKRKTLKDTDVMAAVEEMEFDNFLPGLKTSLDAFKKERKENADKKKKLKEAATKETEQKADTDENIENNMSVDESNNEEPVVVE